MPKTVLDIEP